MPLLSICIPTYNRGKYLDQLLLSIFNELRNLDVDAEICISDNASIDNTQDILNKWVSKFGKFKWVVNEKNIGADLNYINVVGMATGDYVWMIGSDDLLMSNSLASIVDIITGRENLGILLFNRIDCDVDMNVLRPFYWLHHEVDYFEFNFCDFDGIKHYFNSCNSLGGVFSYLSSIIFRKSIWKYEENSKVSEFIGTAYSHVYLLLRSLFLEVNSHLVFHYDSHCYIKNRTNNDSFLMNSTVSRLLLDFHGYYKLSNIEEVPVSLRKPLLLILSREHNCESLVNSLTFYRLKRSDFVFISNNFYIDLEGERLRKHFKYRFYYIFVLGCRRLIYKLFT
jgi:abequosyltransferase